jgi:hypothetical protein
MRIRRPLVAALIFSVACHDATVPTMRAPAPSPRAAVTAADPVIVAAGDIVCGTATPTDRPCKYVETASLVASINPTAVLILGDNQYEVGSLADYNTYYQPTWGAFKTITIPTPGNHEYSTPNAAGYFDYFNGVGVQTGPAGDRSKGYFSTDLGAWHIVSLNSNCVEFHTDCSAGSAQEQWLRADLAAHPNACTLAVWHHTRFSSGKNGGSPQVAPLWQALYDYDADVIVAAHDHLYERFAPQTASGSLDATRGIRAFVAGTGGKELYPIIAVQPNSQVRYNANFGVLKLTLHATSYDWAFLPISGGAAIDSGTENCHGPQQPPPPPPPPAFTLIASATVGTCYQRPGKPHSCHVTAEIRDAQGTLVGGPLAVTGYSTSDTTAAFYYRNPTTGTLEVTNFSGTPWKPGPLTITAYYTTNGVTYRSNGVGLTLMPAPATYIVNATATVNTCYVAPGSPTTCVVTGEVRDGSGNLVGGALTLTGYSTSDTTAATYTRNASTGALEVSNITKAGSITVTAYYVSGGVTYRSAGVTLNLMPAPPPPPPTTYTVTAWATVGTCYVQRPGKPHSCHVTGEVRDNNGTLIGGPLTITGFSTSDTTAAFYWRNPTTGTLEVTNVAGSAWKPGTVTITAFYTRSGVTYRSNGVALTLLPPP